MNARQLEVFRAVMQTGSVTAAAKLLNVTQPTLSKILRHAESQYRLTLFETVRGRLVPTPEAEKLYPHADRVFRDLASLRRLVGQIRDGEGGMARLAVSASVAATIGAEAVAKFHARRPDAHLAFHALPALEVAEKLRSREADLGLTLSPVMAASLETEILGYVEMAALLPDGDPLAQLAEVGPQDIVDRPLISFGSDSHFGQLQDAAFAEKGLERRVAIEIHTGASAPALVGAGAGVAIIDRLLAETAGRGTVWRPFRPRVEVPLTLVLGDMPPSPALVRMLAADLRAAAAARLGGADG
ncbi:LysR substrate-binding domain-containing protein (plasmid) [Thalassobaculum sp. OXR-137]|uniref:LysR substrate-binding domain-containing protein n=1 Tax=Thalassobaculum sp. OXR-137 TaxID=3100173 RepID=UPI002AC92913|nr:LysR substrate-binding domain-containing protein [Thalassobaculum sp. OXR-137]WPZ37186.1 LysR substrate-binding domain-containing protein [Thalassobaculum sp. OXR-137]